MIFYIEISNTNFAAMTHLGHQSSSQRVSGKDPLEDAYRPWIRHEATSFKGEVPLITGSVQKKLKKKKIYIMVSTEEERRLSSVITEF